MMLSFLGKKLIPAISSGAILLNWALPAHSNPFYNQDLRRYTIYTNIYEKAKKELDKDYYILYRITERISRANQLNDFTWRVRILPRYTINAYASETNLVGIYKGLLEQFKGDTSAIACVIAHEMGHHFLKHTAIESSLYHQWVNKFDLNARNKARIINIIRIGGNSLFKKLEKELKTPEILSSLLSSFGLNNINDISKIIIDKINSNTAKKLTLSRLELSRTHELQADEIGYKFSIRAGFNPEGCLRVMEVLSRQEGAQVEYTHPSIDRRKAALVNYDSQYDIQVVKNEGRKNIASTSALNYEYNREEEWLTIYSRFGFPQDDFKRLFPSN